MVLRGKDEGMECEVCVLGETERLGEAGSRELMLNGCAAVPSQLFTIQLYSFYTLLSCKRCPGKTNANMEVQQ